MWVIAATLVCCSCRAATDDLSQRRAVCSRHQGPTSRDTGRIGQKAARGRNHPRRQPSQIIGVQGVERRLTAEEIGELLHREPALPIRGKILARPTTRCRGSRNPDMGRDVVLVLPRCDEAGEVTEAWAAAPFADVSARTTTRSTPRRVAV
jgi:hypothetical protein